MDKLVELLQTHWNASFAQGRGAVMGVIDHSNDVEQSHQAIIEHVKELIAYERKVYAHACADMINNCLDRKIKDAEK